MGSLPGGPRFRGNPLVDDARAPDSEILDWAAVDNCIVLTHDLDFGMLLAALRTDASSVVQVRCQDVLPASIGETVLRAIRATEHQLEAGDLVTVDSARHRIRLLSILKIRLRRGMEEGIRRRDSGFFGEVPTHEDLFAGDVFRPL